MKRQNQAYLYAILSVLLWSTVATAFKLTLKFIDNIQLLMFASVVSLFVLMIILISQKKFSLINQNSFKELLMSAVLGFLNPFLYYLVLFKAYSLLPAQEAQPLNYTWGVVVVLLSIPILKQKIKIKNILALIISLLGVIVISTHGKFLDLKFTNLFGVILAVGSSLIWAVFWIFNVKDKRDEVLKLFLNFAFGSIYIIIYVLIFYKIEIIPMFGLIGSIYIGLFEMGLTFVFWLKAMQLSKTTAQVSNLIYLSPFISMLFIWSILGENILLSSFAGLILIIGGILIQHYKSNSQVLPD